MAGQAGTLEKIEITDPMIHAGAKAILRELTHPERDDIGTSKAEEVAQIVFRAMLAKRGPSIDWK